MTWWGVVLIAWGAFLFGFLMAAVLAAGKRADEMVRAEKAEAEFADVKKEWNKWVQLNSEWISERAVLKARVKELEG